MLLYSFFLLSSAILDFGCCIKYIDNFLQDLFPGFFVFSPDSRDQAGMKMILQDVNADLIESGLDSVDLPDDIDAVGIILDHPLHTPDVTFDRFQPG
jgi:hypothetical protein